MTPFHLITSFAVGPETWHVRLYSVIDYAQQGQGDLSVAGNNWPPGTMEAHHNALQQQQNLKPTPFDASLVTTVGERRISVDSDVLNGVPTYENVKLTLKADPIFAQLIQAAREVRTEIWCEIAIEAPVQNLATPLAGEVYWPRKKRSWFWGKLSRKDLQGTVARQDATVSGNSYRSLQQKVPHSSTGLRVHDGAIEMTFVHWIKVLGAEPAGYGNLVAGHSGNLLEQWLDLVDHGPATVSIAVTGEFVVPAAPPPFYYTQISKLLYLLVQQISPTTLFAIADERLNVLGSPGCILSDMANLHMDWMQLGDANATPLTLTDDLSKIWIATSMPTLDHWSLIGGAWYAVYTMGPSPLFDPGAPGKAPGPMSLYNIKTLAEAITRLPQEFGFEFSVEIPLFDDVDEVLYSSTYNFMMAHWPRVTRWLFQNANYPTATLYLDPMDGTIQYTPAANWITSVTAAMPTPDGYGPAQAKIAFNGDIDERNDLSIKTLFRFLAWEYLPTLSYDYAGVELYLGAVQTALIPAQSVSSPFIRAAGVTSAPYSDVWGDFHALMMLWRWGSARAIVEFDNYGRELEPFGASNAKAGTVRHTFGVGDSGDYGLLRTFTGDFGILPAAPTFAVMELTAAPGKPTHVKAIEIVVPSTGGGAASDTVKNVIPAPPVPPLPPPNNPGGPPNTPTQTIITT